MMGPGPAGRKA